MKVPDLTPRAAAELPPLAVNEREAARILGVCQRTLYGHRAKGSGPKFVRIGGRIVYAVADLQRFLADNAEGGAW